MAVTSSCKWSASKQVSRSARSKYYHLETVIFAIMWIIGFVSQTEPSIQLISVKKRFIGTRAEYCCYDYKSPDDGVCISDRNPAGELYGHGGSGPGSRVQSDVLRDAPERGQLVCAGRGLLQEAERGAVAPRRRWRHEARRHTARAQQKLNEGNQSTWRISISELWLHDGWASWATVAHIESGLAHCVFVFILYWHECSLERLWQNGVTVIWRTFQGRCTKACPACHE